MKGFLKQENLPEKAMLLLDNAPSHPPSAELRTTNGSIFVMFMPPNVTPLIQPMDQNVLRLTKLYYRKGLLTSIISKRQDIADALKATTLKDAVIHLHSAWQHLDALVIQKCWHNILGKNAVDEDDIPLATLREIWLSEQNAIKTTIDLLQAVEPVSSR